MTRDQLESKLTEIADGYAFQSQDKQFDICRFVDQEFVIAFDEHMDYIEGAKNAAFYLSFDHIMECDKCFSVYDSAITDPEKSPNHNERDC